MKGTCLLSLIAFGFGWVLSECSLPAGCFQMAPRVVDKPRVDDKPLGTKELHGTWRILSLSVADEEGVEEIGGPFEKRLLISDKTLRIDVLDRKFLEFLCEYDVKKTPVWIDLSRQFPPIEKAEKMTINKGLLKLDGDRLTVHFGFEVRPDGFEQRKGSKSILLKCSKAKPK